MLTSLLILTLISGILVLFYPPLWSKIIGLTTSSIIFLWSLCMGLLYDPSSPFPQWNVTYNIIPQFSLSFGVDGISLTFVILTAVLIPFCILISWQSIKTAQKEFILTLLILELFLLGTFTALDVFSFYLLFEATLIPIIVVIGGWGSRTAKIDAAFYLFFYTLVGSFLILAGILTLYKLVGTFNWLFLTLNYPLPEHWQLWLWISFFLAFAVKVPIFPFHIWLPQAHVEAPVAGSVLLAGVMLKLGTYGFLRFGIPLFWQASTYFSPFIITLSILAIIWASLTTLRQTDIKRIIAYSSVAHIGVVTIGLFSLLHHGIMGSVTLILAHGLISSALFIAVTFVYDRYHTRTLRYYQGLTTLIPIWSTLLLLALLANIGFPGSANFLGEWLVLISIYNIHPILSALAGTGIILSGAYSLFFFNRIAFGQLSAHIRGSFSDLTKREFHSIAFLILITYILGINPTSLYPLLESTLTL